jgi:hypothetical protein
MTFVLGINCFDGIVLAADSLEDDGVNRKMVDKLKWFGNENHWSVAYGCSGNSTIISVFEQKVQELFFGSSILLEPYNRTDIQEQLEAALTYTYQKYPNEKLDVIAGLWGRNPIDKAIFHAYYGFDCLQIVDDYGIAGTDSSLANTLLNSIFVPSMSTSECVRLAVFVTAIMKEKASGVGGPTKVMSHRIGTDDWDWHEPNEITDLEQKYPLDDFYDLLLKYWSESNPDFMRPIGRFPRR